MTQLKYLLLRYRHKKIAVSANPGMTYYYPDAHSSLWPQSDLYTTWFGTCTTKLISPQYTQANAIMSAEVNYPRLPATYGGPTTKYYYMAQMYNASIDLY